MGSTADQRIESTGHPLDPARLEPLRNKLLERLRARSREVEEAIVAAALSIRPLASDDGEGLAGLRASARETVELIADLIEQGADWTPRLPPAVAAQVRHLARSGVTLDAVMRGHYATTSLCFEFATSEISDLPQGTLPYLVEVQSWHGDALMSATSAEYEAELARLECSPSARCLEEQVRRLLAGEPVDTDDVDYDFDGWHLGAIVLGPKADLAARRLAERLGCRLLLVPRDSETTWAWLGANRPVSPADLERLVPAKAGDRIAIALGEAREGLDGWSLTHREAQIALEVMRRRPQPLVRCADVVLLAAALRDEELGRILVASYLGPLDERRDGRVLRDTLRSYLASACNAASTAASLGVDRHTVQRRLRRVEEAIGRRLDTCRAELEVALDVEEHTGPGGSSSRWAMRHCVPFRDRGSPT